MLSFRNTYDNWPVIFINHNLSLEVRVLKDNLIIAMIIPGPKTSKNLNSFLVPLIDELKLLEGIIACFSLIILIYIDNYLYSPFFPYRRRGVF